MHLGTSQLNEEQKFSTNERKKKGFISKLNCQFPYTPKIFQWDLKCTLPYTQS